MSWEEWIVRQESGKSDMTSYDFLCELCVSSYDLSKKSRKADLKDKVHFFILWWNTNKSKMSKYTGQVKIGQLLGVDHTTIVHFLKRRKPTIFYEENVKCINDFLNS
jgi:hypothetical protein